MSQTRDDSPSQEPMRFPASPTPGAVNPGVDSWRAEGAENHRRKQKPLFWQGFALTGSYWLERRRPDSNRGITDLQSAALPLGYGAGRGRGGENLPPGADGEHAIEARRWGQDERSVRRHFLKGWSAAGPDWFARRFHALGRRVADVDWRPGSCYSLGARGGGLSPGVAGRFPEGDRGLPVSSRRLRLPGVPTGSGSRRSPPDATQRGDWFDRPSRERSLP